MMKKDNKAQEAEGAQCCTILWHVRQRLFRGGAPAAEVGRKREKQSSLSPSSQ